MSIPEEIIERIRERVSISELISDSVTLKRTGKNLVGLCPFHREKSPSFNVNEDMGSFHCFGCGKRGSAFDFVMETRGLNFIETVHFLAKRVGIEVPESRGGSSGESDAARRQRIFLKEVFHEAAQYYHRTFFEDKGASKARSYLSNRKLSDDTLRAFDVGYAPDRDELLQQLVARWSAKNGTPISEQLSKNILSALVTLGLVKQRGDGSRYDMFRGRVIFPISKSDRSVVALGGRLLAPHPTRPKYINSTENPLYSKRKTLFGLAQALELMRTTREVYLVEGYMDVVSLHQIGVTNAVASCGTAVTLDHVHVLKRFVDRVILVFDGDMAGMKAAANAFPVFLNSKLDVFGVSLPTGEDPASMFEKDQIEPLREALFQQRVPIVDLFIQQRLGAAGETKSEKAAYLGKVAEEFARSVAKVENPVEREFLLQRAADILGVSEQSLQSLLHKGKKADGFGDSPQSPSRQASHSASPPKPPPARRSTEESRQASSSEGLPGMLQQVLVTALCEPRLADNLLRIESFWALDSRADQSSEKIRAWMSVRENVRRCIVALFNERPAGVTELVRRSARPGSPEWEAAMGSLRAVLERYELDATVLLAEALRRSHVGGMAVGKFMEDMARVPERYSLSGEVTKLRSQEGGAESAEHRAQLAQEKLLKRRELERLRRPG